MMDCTAWELENTRTRAALAVEITKMRKAQERADFLSGLPADVLAALDTDHPIVKDIKARALQYYTISEKQTALVLKLAHEAAQPVAERAVETLVVAPTGKAIKFTGVVVSTKVQEGHYGLQYRMTVKVGTPETGTWLAWGTIPSGVMAYLDTLPPGADSTIQGLKGLTVEIKADLEAGTDRVDSHDRVHAAKPYFVFMKRPRGKVQPAAE